MTVISFAFDLGGNHTAKQYWTTNHAKESRDIIFQEELR